MNSGTVVWRFRDGKAGHERQTAGLLGALARLRSLSVFDVHTATTPRAWWDWCCGRVPAGLSLPTPQLVLGAGSGCAWPVLASARATGAFSVYLMKPPLPWPHFDLCFVPRHDSPAASARVAPTEGVLNDLDASLQPRDGPTAILVGGPSRHHDWREDDLLQQIASVVFGQRERNVVIADSRRTPAATTARLRDFCGQGVRFVSHETSGPAWLRDTLHQAAAVWVTADSVSMLFEALTAGCPVGVLAVPARRADRITAIAGDLVAQGRVSSLKQWLASGRLPAPQALAEAARCAAVLDARLPPAAAG